MGDLFDEWQTKIDRLVVDALATNADLPEVPSGVDSTDQIILYVMERIDITPLPDAISQRLDGGIIDALMGYDQVDGRDPERRLATHDHRRWQVAEWRKMADHNRTPHPD